MLILQLFDLQLKLDVYAPFDIGGCNSTDSHVVVHDTASVCSVNIESVGDNYRFINNSAAIITKESDDESPTSNHFTFQLENVINVGQSK